jgi:hypothetical protein
MLCDGVPNGNVKFSNLFCGEFSCVKRWYIPLNFTIDIGRNISPNSILIELQLVEFNINIEFGDILRPMSIVKFNGMYHLFTHENSPQKRLENLTFPFGTPSHSIKCNGRGECYQAYFIRLRDQSGYFRTKSGSYFLISIEMLNATSLCVVGKAVNR